jgi:hypothetical protein
MFSILRYLIVTVLALWALGWIGLLTVTLLQKLFPRRAQSLEVQLQKGAEILDKKNVVAAIVAAVVILLFLTGLIRQLFSELPF